MNRRSVRPFRTDRPDRTKESLAFEVLAYGLALAALCAVLVMGAGCRGDGHDDSLATGSHGTSSGSRGRSVDRQRVDQLEREYVVGPAAARELNYRIDWQYGEAGKNLRHVVAQGDSVFTLDENNFLSRVRVEDGNRLWKVPGAGPIDEVLGITLIDDKVYLTTGGALIVLAGGTGAQIGKQPFEKIANTAPAQFERYLIYGSRNGQVVWHSFDIAYQFRSYKVGHSINLAPVIAERYLAVVGNDGTVMVLNASSGSQYWSRKLLDQIVASPAIANGSVYVAGLDQHLRAYDVATGRNLWKVLTQSPLNEAPVVIEDRLYQQVPAQGLVCYNAVPIDLPGGEEIWTASGVKGSVIVRRRDQLLVWDSAGKNMTIVDAGRGGVVQKIAMPQAAMLTTGGEKGEDIYAASSDGRVVRLTPRN